MWRVYDEYMSGGRPLQDDILRYLNKADEHQSFQSKRKVVDQENSLGIITTANGITLDRNKEGQQVKYEEERRNLHNFLTGKLTTVK